MRTYRLALVPLLLALGCGGGDLPSTATIVRMADNEFSPREIRVDPGTEVWFRNMGMMPHNALAIDGAWGAKGIGDSLEIHPGKWVPVKFNEPGVYRFYCSFHGTRDGSQGMVGTIIVGDVPLAVDSGAGRLAPVGEPTGVVRRVPSEYPGVQAAVDAAAPGDLILIGPGTYREEVQVTTPSLTIRGEDRNTVILDGEFVRANGFGVFADGVAIENLTTKRYTLNGVFVNGVTGYRTSYVTALNNGDYGIYVYVSSDGIIEHSYASGSPDAGVYIGACQPCRAVVHDIISEHNDLGYSGTNSGGDLYLIQSSWSDNYRNGVSPNTWDIEPVPPARGTTIIGNRIERNPGSGIHVMGASQNLIERNLIRDNGRHGILINSQRDRRFYPSIDNVIRDNVVIGSAVDLALGGVGNIGNCFEGNRYRTASPGGLALLQRCGGARVPLVGNVNNFLGMMAGRRSLFNPSGDARGGDWWKKVPEPAPQPTMPGGATAPVVVALHPFASYRLRLESIPLPDPTEKVIAGEVKRP